MDFAPIAEITRRQHGLVTREQLLPLVGRRAIERALGASRLELVRTAVYRVAGAPESWEQLVLAACLAGGPTAHASFRAAAALWELEGFSHEDLEITVSRKRRARLPGVVVHQSAVWGTAHSDRRGGIPVTSMARTLCDITAVVPAWRVERAVDEALRRKVVTLRRLAMTWDALAGRGRRRGTVMQELLARRLPGYDPGESEPEKRIADLLVRAGLPEPVRQHGVRLGSRRARIDLCYPAEKIAIEYDSWGYHGSRSAFDDDRARGNELVVLGFQLLRFTSKSSESHIVEMVGAALTRAGAA